MKTTEITSSAHEDTDQGSLDRVLENREVAKSNNVTGGGDGSLDESMPMFDSTLVEVPFSAAGAEDEKYADGRLFALSVCTQGLTIRQNYKV